MIYRYAIDLYIKDPSVFQQHMGKEFAEYIQSTPPDVYWVDGDPFKHRIIKFVEHDNWLWLWVVTNVDTGLSLGKKELYHHPAASKLSNYNIDEPAYYTYDEEYAVARIIVNLEWNREKY